MTKSLTPIRFGTDGWRAIISEDYTFTNLERVTQAYATYLLDQAESVGATLVVVGYDRRFLSEKYAHRSCEVLVGNGLRVALFPYDCPTPLISWAVKVLQAGGGVVITASHNPYDFNGFKIKAPWGGSATPEATAKGEGLLDKSPVKRSPVIAEGQELLGAAIESYRQQIESYIDLERLRTARGNIVVDPMHGTGGRWVEGFLSGGTLKVETIRADRDPLFGGVNPEPIDRNLSA
ncbi:MAG TPA: hypothetical protein VGN86_13595, partial [Pyrinomonadaceae bacterium]|nr:hypothetical protein [Pyrinomonadaceae bacterium]